ncbi:hypothetical protein PV11_01741 [Exophiala sideris]|uniref:Folliculin-interacting protein N-terminal domain-containing protein n=1 Tax=Exophiala sideris TaxID=1016849 RepID=A0A0D1XDS4_9EURO|nr:hypothetical protein PV11_01741 [Exophiala sideris]
MLGRLIQGVSRGGQLESATDETHTRTLLWPDTSPEGRYGSLSPPTTPFGSPNLRASPFDDRLGLELNETKDLRLIIAQDAFGTLDRPLLLYDSQTAGSATPPTEVTSPTRTQFSPQTEHGYPIIGHIRNRSSTISGASASWARSNKESEPTDQLSNILDCMFGVSSAAKSGSSTKIHMLPGDRGSATSPASRTPSATATAHGVPIRAPLLRAKTSMQGAHSLRQHASPKEPEIEARDSVLITRMFPVNLPGSKDDLRQHRTSSAGEFDAISPMTPSRDSPQTPGAQAKKPKLVEKKSPVYAIGLLFYLPRSSDARPKTSAGRPSSRASFAASSTPNSFGSDSFSSWVFLNAIPEHLWSSETSGQLTDKSIQIIVKNWDIILRSLSPVEAVARAQIGELLQDVNQAMISSAAKAPKGPSEQRTNQRNIYIRSPNVLTRDAHLHALVRHTLWRVAYALRIPRVLTGFGLDNGGHWLDESRYLVRLCGNKQQNFFLFNLLTAFLGNHTEWLERLAPDWYRKQIKALNKGQLSTSSLASRTVVICDSRSMTRRIIFLLSSFLPRSPGGSVLTRDDSGYISPILTPDAAIPVPSSRITEGSLRRHVYNKSRDGSMTFPRREVTGLSASVSSGDSVGAIGKALRSNSQSVFPPPELQSSTSKQPAVFTPDASASVHKTNATSSTATPGTGTPVPHFATKNDSYFPDGAVLTPEETGASADLARILRRDSVSQPANQSSINWGSPISNVSGLWNRNSDSSPSSNRPPPSADRGSLRDRRGLTPRTVPIQAGRPSPLERMVDEASDLRKVVIEGKGSHISTPTRRSSVVAKEARPPELTVDDKDGVIDVDITLPGFVGWMDEKSSSTRRQSPSVASADEVRSSFSHHFHHTETTRSKPLNVAGFLKRYHEDFILQGVKPYQELYEEIKQSMLREVTPTQEPSGSPSRGHDQEPWVNVCTTLLADYRSFTIRRLTLQRRVQTDTLGVKRDTSNPTTNAETATARSGTFRHGKASAIEDDEAERFVSETVMDFDITLTDAIERVLNEADPSKYNPDSPQRTHSRTVSSGIASSANSQLLDISSSGKGKDWSRRVLHSQFDCRRAVVGALEEVVKSVNDDLAKHHRSKDDDGNLKLDGQALEQEIKQDNVLREGVKKWLLNVETRSVW